MTGPIVFLFLISNLAWLVACLSLMVHVEQLNWLVGWTGLTVESDPASLVPYAILIAFVGQLMLLLIIFWMRSRDLKLTGRVRELKTANKNLAGTSQKTEKELSGKLQEAEAKTGALEREKEQLSTKVNRLENGKESLIDQVKGWFKQ